MLFKNFKKGDIVVIAVYDCFEGDVRILKKRRKKIFIEIIDVCNCYPCQAESEAGETMWIPDYLIFSIEKNNKN